MNVKQTVKEKEEEDVDAVNGNDQGNPGSLIHHYSVVLSSSFSSKERNACLCGGLLSWKVD